MKSTIINKALLASSMMLAFVMTSCSDFFQPDTEDQLSEDTYISDNTEMYMGFLGLMTKLQAAGDKEIYLTDTRAEFLEPTINAGSELYALYNYKEDLQGNKYANPSEYYEIIIACNDYLAKVIEYRKQPQVDQDISKALISSTIRLKVWAYKTIGEIYGEAAWIDQPIGDVNKFLKEENYEMLNMEQISDRCLALLENGYDDAPADLRVDWVKWLDQANETNMPNSSFYEYLFMVPDFGGLYTELALWKASYLDGAGDKLGAQVYYKKAADVITATLDQYVSMTSPYLPVDKQRNTLMNNSGSDNIGSSPYWLPSAASPGAYPKIWYQERPDRFEMASVIQYEWENNQTNQLARHFNSDGTAEFLLQPSEAGMLNFTDNTKNPGGSENDGRFKYLVGNYHSTQPYMCKYRENGGRGTVRTEAYMSDMTIYTYRATQYYLLLCEALNNLGRFTALDCILNKGFTDNGYTTDLVFLDTLNVEEAEQLAETDIEYKQKIQRYNSLKDEFEGFNRNWTSSPEWLARKYYFTGVRGAYSATGLTPRTILTLNETSLPAAKRANDIQILREAELELSCEGKTLPWMNRLAVRYGDLSIVADEVCPKYEAAGKAGEIRGKILAGGNWVKYNIK